MSQPWIPSDIEKKCLTHLDAPNAWTLLRRDPPNQEDILPWTYFSRVFVFNFPIFATILTAIFLGLELANGSNKAYILEDLPYGLAAVIVIATALSLYVTHLYRKSWNGRAKHLVRE